MPTCMGVLRVSANNHAASLIFRNLPGSPITLLHLSLSVDTTHLPRDRRHTRQPASRRAAVGPARRRVQRLLTAGVRADKAWTFAPPAYAVTRTRRCLRTSAFRNR